MHGMIYSSIERNKKNYNIVFRPNHAKMIFSIYKIQTFEILEIDNNRIRLKLKRIGKTYGTKNHPLDNFNILWEELIEENQLEETINYS